MSIVADPMKLSLPEQVGENKKQIKKIWEFLDGLSVSDNVIKITSLNQLTAEELGIVKRDIAFIVYGNEIYYKTKTTSSEAIFEKLIKFELSEYITLSSNKIIVTLSNGALGAETSSANIYSKAQVDTFLALKAEKSYVDNNFAKLSGASFTGSITAPSIIEDMSGYTFTKQAGLDAESVIYAGVCKNGNKITFVIFGTYTKPSSDAPVNPSLGEFLCPKEVANKLFPFSSWYLDYTSIEYASGASDTRITLPCAVIKEGRKVRFAAYGVHGPSLTAETAYVFRIEATFLLSENLAQ